MAKTNETKFKPFSWLSSAQWALQQLRLQIAANWIKRSFNGPLVCLAAISRWLWNFEFVYNRNRKIELKSLYQAGKAITGRPLLVIRSILVGTSLNESVRQCRFANAIQVFDHRRWGTKLSSSIEWHWTNVWTRNDSFGRRFLWNSFISTNLVLPSRDVF